MRSLNYSDVFNVNTINIFTDASIKKFPEQTISCPGAALVATDELGNRRILEYNQYLDFYATNNTGEIKAISLGVMMATKYKNTHTINLFSDSNVCIQGLREWIFNWINTNRNNTLYNSTGNEVKNQDMFKTIINYIVFNNIKINFYHQKGHVDDINNKFLIEKAINDFKVTNNMENVDIELIKTISIYNDYVDKHTRMAVQNSHPSMYKYNDKKKIIEHELNNVYKYKTLINK